MDFIWPLNTKNSRLCKWILHWLVITDFIRQIFFLQVLVSVGLMFWYKLMISSFPDAFIIEDMSSSIRIDE